MQALGRVFLASPGRGLSTTTFMTAAATRYRGRLHSHAFRTRMPRTAQAIPTTLPLLHPAQEIIRMMSSSSSAPSNNTMLEDVVVTNSCIKQIKALQAREKKQELKLRLSVEGGGCSGFTYSFTTEEGPAQEDDRVFGRDGAQVLVDEGSLEFVRGSTVDFTEDMMRSAFAVVNNPQSESACGCGSSFAMKNFEKNPAID